MPRMKSGDPVVYLADRDLYGEMEILDVRKDCVICLVDPDSKRPSYERFDLHEIDVPVPEAA